MIQRSQRLWNVWASLVLLGCSAAHEDSIDAEVAQAHSVLPRAEMPTLDEFVESARQKIQVGDEEIDAYVLEGDMFVPYEMVVAYYEGVYLAAREKSVGFIVRIDGPAGPFSPPLQIRTSFPIRYCVDTSFNSIQRASLTAAIDRAGAAWNAASSRLTWEHVSSLDGGDCTSSAEGKDIVVTRSPGASQGPFPGEASQVLRFPFPVPPAGIMLHELGHVLGLMHEQFHSKSGLDCAPAIPVITGMIARDISADWDPQSVMQYLDADGRAACASEGSTPGFLSANDKVAARTLYGP